MPPVSLLIKPASSLCNLRCNYCFYHAIAKQRQIECYGIMDLETLETIVKEALIYADHSCTFAFQGGEPTLAGLDFYKKLMEFEKKYNVKKVQINHALQTNGIEINDQWASFLAEHRFLVGISLDGSKEIHDQNRMDMKSEGSFNKVMNAIALFNKYKVAYNILSVVTGNLARHVGKVYAFFKKNNFKYLQFIPCLDSLTEPKGANPYSLTPARYTIFLKNLFDLWYEDEKSNSRISIRFFDNLLGIFMGYRPEACDMLGKCTSQFIIEADGSVYPCDFYVIDKWRLGNIKDTSFLELKNSEKSIRFINSSENHSPKCQHCKWFNLCHGGCRRDRLPLDSDSPGLNYFCSSYQEFYAYAGDRLRKLAHNLNT